MKHNEIHTMSEATADILMPRADGEIYTATLGAMIRHISETVDDAGDGDSLREWAWRSLKTFPSIPTKEEVAQQFPPFHLPMPEWQ